ncbi:hypothetical protein Goshw_008312 [Gossypium schwendimanii]|uniref:Uncharacterized protein n=1 Tax=Gossypium schwendimanii TaxID=34291 RepID=A0A7J9L1R5_GOSSC|nr:hypothetical protein [Gossypium schwendimanii]
MPRLPLNQIPTSPIILSPVHRQTSMAAYHYRITFKALVIMSVLILAWQPVAARLVPTDHSSAPVIGCNAKGYTPVYGESCPPPNVLPIEHSSAPVIGGNVTGHTSVYGKSGKRRPGNEPKRSQERRRLDTEKIYFGTASGTPSTGKRSRTRGTKEAAATGHVGFSRHRYKAKSASSTAAIKTRTQGNC